MNDKDIIKALELCANVMCMKVGCDKCPNNYGDCKKDIFRKTLDLINRQKAEIERLQKAGEEAVSCFTRMESLYKIKCKELEVIKIEAIKEFAERFGALLADFDDYDTLHIYEIKDRLDLVKEMTENDFKE